MTKPISATARHIRTERIGGQVAIIDDNTGRTLGKADLIHGFAHYFGVRGESHEGMKAVVTGGIEGLTKALAEGLRNGRDDRR